MNRLLSNHGLAFLAISRRPDIRIREVAAELEITERAAQAIVSHLVQAGYVRRIREGRRNRYEILGPPPGELPASPAGILAAAGDPAQGGGAARACEAVVLACTDYRIQHTLGKLVGRVGLPGGAEVLLWPGGGPALAGPDGDSLYDALVGLVRRRRPSRLLFVSHAGCEVPDVPTLAGGTPATALRSVRRWARRIVREAHDRLGMDPELWLLDGDRAIRFSWAGKLERAGGRAGRSEAAVSRGSR